ncbi:MAG: protein kinase [Deltaproteobacteria bacterium]|nr:protein kinase [Deltaproteobacteria bacterium]
MNANDERVGTRVDGLLLEALLGSGAASRVYLARGPDGPCAVKVLHDHRVQEPGLSRRLREEAHALGSLDHENIVQVLGAGTTADGAPYIAMELVDGLSLERLLGSVRPSPAAIVEMTRQLARGLDAAHAKGVVHRDLKPANVLVRIGEPPTLKIVDFGIARRVAPNDSTRLTARGALLGTPEYVAPEQIKNPSSAGPAADLYSLGVILHRMIARRNPFVGNLFEVLAAQLDEAPPSLPECHGLEVIARALLEKEPARRPTARQVIEALDRLHVAEESIDWSAETFGGQTETEVSRYGPRVADAGARPHPVTERSVEEPIATHSPRTSWAYAASAVLAVSALVLLLWPESTENWPLPVRPQPAPAMTVAAPVIPKLQDSPARVVPQSKVGILEGSGGGTNTGSSAVSLLHRRAAPARRAEQPELHVPRVAARPTPAPVEAPPKREPVSPPATVALDPLGPLDRSIGDELSLRGLEPADLNPDAKAIIEAARVAARSSDKELVKLRLWELRVELERLEIPRSLLERRVERIRRSIEAAALNVDPVKLETFENRYLDLRTSIPKGDALDRRRMLVAAYDLEREITATR